MVVALAVVTRGCSREQSGVISCQGPDSTGRGETGQQPAVRAAARGAAESDHGDEWPQSVHAV